MIDLPKSDTLNASALCRLFSNTTNSYKFLFFISFLDIIARKHFDSTPIELHELTTEMLCNAWYPHTYFKLSFGSQDQVAKTLDNLNLEVTEQILKFNDPEKRKLREIINENEVDLLLQKYVPYRLIRVFFETELKGLQDSLVNRKIENLANSEFHNYKPLYCFTTSSQAIIPHSEWLSYFKINFKIVKSWVLWEWLQYMQRCNPNVPAISKKLIPPTSRTSLLSQINYWKLVIDHVEVRCIYTNAKLRTFDLDHYLPWSFVAHDQLWNLIPAEPSVNSAKSNYLPSSTYLDDLIRTQHMGLTVSKRLLPEKKWLQFVDPYIADLKLCSVNNLLNESKLSNAYYSTIPPLISLASNQGFMPEWRYEEKHYEILPSDKAAIETQSNKVQIIEFLSEEEKYKTHLPLYSLSIAAGRFLESDTPIEPEAWMDVSKYAKRIFDKNMFVSQISGKSMEPTIPNGSYCIFTRNIAGSKNGKIVLAQKLGLEDVDTGASYTLKKYSSTKVSNVEMEWTHESIVLKSINSNYPDIDILPEESENFSIIAIFIDVLEV